jgi:hypothetical protein
MGLLDEAIREHLDLKRRRGADPDEIERAEREALGPVRRPPEPGDVEHAGAVDEQPGAVEPDETGEAAVEQPLPVEGIDEVAGYRAEGAEAEPEPAADDHSYEGAPDPSEAPPPPSPPPGPETAEYDVEHEQREEERQKEPGEDVLEETPEFLHDAPDHDRLWFEQRPPKDFDFEG